MFEDIWRWAHDVGERIKQKDEDLLRKLIIHIRGEETPGRFLEKLSSMLCEYKTNKNIGVNVSIKPELVKIKWHGDKFYYMKSAILAGLINALVKEEKKNE
ncbi:MAG: hypothetical protein QW472_05655 [Candidatus Aenigmatarchaeota archaeon]